MEPDTTEHAYELLDSGGGSLLEKVGEVTLSRPSPHAWWRRRLTAAEWKKAAQPGPGPLRISFGSLRFEMVGTGGLRAVGPELRAHWERAAELCAAFEQRQRRAARVLNLFAGEGGFTIATAAAGADVTHVGADNDTVLRARQNANLSLFAARSIRWVVDHPVKFVQREHAQNRRHDFIILDPPAARGGKEGFQIERELPGLLATSSALLSGEALGVILICRHGSVLPTTLLNLMQQEFSVFGGRFEHGELLLHGAEGVLPVPCGVFCRWLKIPE